MEDDKGLDLSLSLPCGGPSAVSKGKIVISSDGRADEAGNSGSKLIDDFKNFLEGSNHKEESAGPSNMEVDNKRKNVFDEINNKQRHENEGVADAESTSVDLKSQRAFTIGPFPGQSANVVNMPYSLSVKKSNSILGSQRPVISANLPLMFGTVSEAVTPVNGSGPFDTAKGDGKKPKEDGPSMRTEINTKGINVINESRPDGLPAIRPGIAAELKIGGNGSAPNLPWVSSTGPGPNGKTISGVTYKYNASQIRIVCACHGLHMSPEEFSRHASEEQTSLNGVSAGSLSFSNGNPTAFAQN